MSRSLPPELAGLLRPEAYPHPGAAVEVVETHVSWVLLAGEFAYKIKRPVRYPFVDLRCPERRRFLCEEELRLNRRFAPELYLEIRGLVREGGALRIGAPEGAEE
jgi:aminoglycoside phosphotransferase family enzyme